MYVRKIVGSDSENYHIFRVIKCYTKQKKKHIFLLYLKVIHTEMKFCEVMQHNRNSFKPQRKGFQNSLDKS